MVKFSLINDMQDTIRMKIERNGRPPILLTTEQIIQVEALAAVCTKSQMAAYFGVTEKTFRAIEKRQPEVFTAYRRGRARAVADIGSNLYQRALEGDIRAMQFYLKTQAGWSGRKRVELSRLEDTHQNLQWTVELVSVT